MLFVHRSIFAAFASASLIATTSAQADQWPSSGNFDVVETARGCAAGGDFALPGRSNTSFLVSFDGDEVVMVLGSRDWTPPADGTEVSFRFTDEGVFTGPISGTSFSNGQKGFAANFSPAVLEPFARSGSLVVAAGETVVAHLNMRGSAAAAATLRRCTDSVLRRNAAQAREEQAFDYIARDPFGEGIAPAPGPVRPPVITNPVWAVPPRPTYPDRAVEGRLEGSAELSCTVNGNGSVSACSIVSETPAGAGFGRAALAGVRTARLSPRSVDGVVSGGSVRFTQRFELPD
jgi:TonB family protein